MSRSPGRFTQHGLNA